MAHRKTDPSHPDAAGHTAKDPEDWTTGDEPMTGAQRSYLQTLCEGAGEPLGEPLTKAQASVRIAALQQRTGRGRARGARDQAEEGSAAAGMRDAEGAADEEGLEEVCPGCGLERSAWQGKGGRRPCVRCSSNCWPDRSAASPFTGPASLRRGPGRRSRERRKKAVCDTADQLGGHGNGRTINGKEPAGGSQRVTCRAILKLPS
jgi:Protein of unknown function (DUF3072)